MLGDAYAPTVTAIRQVEKRASYRAASLAIAAGANVKAVQRMLGHASAAMTLDIYAGLFADDLDVVATNLDLGARIASADCLRANGPESSESEES